MYVLDPLPRAIRCLTDDEAARLRSLYAANDLPPSPEQCITCHGTGSFRWYDPERTAPADWKCNCEDQWVLHRYLLNAGIDLAYQRMAWKDARQVEEGAKEWVRAYVGNIDALANHGLGLIMHGTNGTGKSLVATLLLKMLLTEGWDGYFTTFQALLNQFTSGWRDPGEQRWFHRRIKNAGILVVDDVGKEGMKGTEVPMATFDEVIRHRVAASRPTIITTNYTIGDLQKSYGGSVMSLLRGSAMEYEFTGRDYRPQWREQKIEEAKLGLTRPVVLS